MTKKIQVKKQKEVLPTLTKISTLGEYLTDTEVKAKTVVKNLPWEVIRVFPEINLYGNSIQFCSEGDSITKEEAINTLNFLLASLESKEFKK
jgi:hypothetical protein